MLAEIGRALSAELYPNATTNQEIPPERLLRLAQAYQAEFKPTGLHAALRTLVADDDFTPATAHERLLRLPWADVFTTNWDTLLERASETVRDRVYTIVRSKHDIPGGARPRIIKLHGSLPDSALVLTEEDYRTYPTKFLPFVNTVQQAMMETTFVLIGFSGNDPNFLHWSGWVRDHLDEAALNIYLAGLLNLSRPERQMLRDRNVVAIDLALHPRADEWPDGLRHEYATKWILSALECGQPYNISKWPTPRPATFCSEEDPLLDPIIRNVSAEPRREPSESPREIPSDERLIAVKKTLDIWKYNRDLFPRWLVAPGRVRSEVWYSTERWMSFVVQELTQLAALERLTAIRDIIWRYELTLETIPDELHAAAEAVLRSIDCTGRTVEGIRPDDVDWSATRGAWQEVTLALLTAARYRLDGAAFEKHLNAVQPILDDDVEAAHRVNHERCLWALWALDHATVGERLDAWRTDEGDSAWAMRKSALLREIGRKEDADRLTMRVVERIRATRDGPGDLGGRSREGWALWSLVETFAYDGSFQTRWDNVQARWDELAVVKCNPYPDVRNLSDQLSTDRRETRVPAFDLGMRPTESHTMQMVRPPSASRGIRLTEVAGVAPTTGVRTVAGGLVKRAAEALISDDATLGMRQMIRVAESGNDKALRRVLTRPRVAALTAASARALSRDVQIALKNSVSDIRTTRDETRFKAVRHTSVAMESLSRLVLRLEPGAALSIFDRALGLYRDTSVMEWIQLHGSLRNLLRRSWETLDDEQRTERILDVLETPIVGLDGYASAGDHWPDPSEILSEDLSPVRSEENENRWNSVVATLIRGSSAEGQVRERAAVRLAKIALWGRLAKTETERVAEAIWGVAADEEQALPDGTSLHDYAFILLPEPKVGVGRARFGRKWLSGDVANVRLGGEVGHKDSTRADDILWQAGMSVAFVRRHGRTLDLTNEEKDYLIGVIDHWSRTRAPKPSVVIPEFFRDLRTRSIWDACRGLRWLLTEIRIPNGLAERLYGQVPELIDSGISAYGILPGIDNVDEDLREDIALLMSTGLASDDRKMGESAMWSLHCWLRFASESALDFVGPPQHLIREIGVSVATRRRTVLGEALHAAKWIFEDGSEEERDAIRDLVLKGLGYLAEELRYDREDPLDEKLDVPLARWRSIQVARAMAGQGLGGHPVVKRWLQLGMDDPLPEVRRVANRRREGDAMVEVAGADGRHEFADEGGADA
ncbi:MAG: SIR2 family protein [Gemmatimonadota bacterium]|nr:SIR2 family protein [Gemmatimonadota bacterium]